MTLFLESLNAMLPIILITGLGYLLARFGPMSEQLTELLNPIVYRLLFPVSLFLTSYRANIAEDFNPRLIGYVSLMIPTTILLAWLLFRKLTPLKSQQAALIQTTYRGNFLILAIPLSQNLFGEQGLAVVSLMMPFVLIPFSVYSIILFTLMTDTNKQVTIGKTILNILRNPMIVSALIGLLLNALRVPLPLALDRAMNSLTQAASPIALLMLGATLLYCPRDEAGSLSLVRIGTLLRLLAVPLIWLPVSILLGFRGAELGALAILVSAPSAINCYIMASNLGGDGNLTARLVVSTTVFSSLSLTLVIYLLKLLQLIQ